MTTTENKSVKQRLRKETDYIPVNVKICTFNIDAVC